MSNQSGTPILKVDVEKMTVLEGARAALVMLKKADAYIIKYNTMNTGIEVSMNIVQDLRMRQRAVEHRIEILEEISQQKRIQRKAKAKAA